MPTTQEETARLREVIDEYWKKNEFIHQDVSLPFIDYPDLVWVPYESYMRAKLVRCIAGEIGELLIEFPSESSEDNRLHIHPNSDRVVTVIEGHGRFVVVREGERAEYDLRPGSQVHMPRGVLHTFFAGPRGLQVHALHNPFVPLDDPAILIYPDDS